MRVRQNVGTWPWRSCWLRSASASWYLCGISQGENCALRLCPFLSGQRITFIWQRFTKTSLPDHDLTLSKKGLTSRILQPTTRLSNICFWTDLLKTFSNFGFLGHVPPISLYEFVINISLFQTLAFSFDGPHSASGTWTCNFGNNSTV